MQRVNGQNGLPSACSLLEGVEGWLWGQFPKMGAKKEEPGVAKAVQTRLCGRGGAGTATLIKMFFCWSLAYMC